VHDDAPLAWARKPSLERLTLAEGGHLRLVRVHHQVGGHHAHRRAAHEQDRAVGQLAQVEVHALVGRGPSGCAPK